MQIKSKNDNTFLKNNDFCVSKVIIFIIYHYIIKNGAGSGAQTRDLCLGKAGLLSLPVLR